METAKADAADSVPAEITFTLGVEKPQVFTIKTLSFAQMRAVVPALTKFIEDYNGRLESDEAFDTVANAILGATRKSNPEFARTTLDELDVTTTQLIGAVDELLVFTRLFKKKAKAPDTGEASTVTSETAKE